MVRGRDGQIYRSAQSLVLNQGTVVALQEQVIQQRMGLYRPVIPVVFPEHVFKVYLAQVVNDIAAANN